MKKSVLVLLLLMLMLACTTAPKTNQQQPATNFRTGTQGISLDFVTNLPPPRLFDRDPFHAMIAIENRGTSKVGQGLDRVYLSGFDHTVITGIPSDGLPIPPLEGRGPYILRGGFDTISFTGVIASLADKRIDKYNPLILATACYNYETVASGQVCIDPDPYAATSVQKVCTPTPVSLGSQGAPVGVTTISVEPAPSKTRFVINLQNVGGGNVFKYGNQYLNKCSPYSQGLGFDEIDYVQIQDVSVSGTSIKQTCKPIDKDNHIRLTNSAAQLFCEYDNIPGEGAYLAPINVILRYGYRQSVAKPIEIRPVS